MPATLIRPDYRLADNLAAKEGVVFLTGTQALIRLALMQSESDAAHGIKTQGFISGYRGSPLGMVDQQAWKAKALLEKAGVEFLPAINEELGATAVLGTQRVESDPERTADGVFALWYGKGPGLDRAGDALKHGNAYGSSPHGGVLVIAGDDHGCVSSSMPHQSDVTMQSWHMPVVAPANVAEYLEFGLYGWALSRFSGNWVGFTALSETVESGSTVDLDETHARVAAWQGAEALEAAAASSGFVRPADGLHYRWPDLPSLQIEQRLHAKLDAVRAFAKVNSIDRQIVESAQATVGIVTCGKAHLDLLEVFRRLDISLDALAEAGVRLYKVGLSYPLEPTRLDAFADGLSEILVVEEKGPVVETQLRDLFYNRSVRPRIVGKHDAAGQALVSAIGETRPSRLIEIVADWLAAHFAQLDRRSLVVDFTPPELLSNVGDAVKRVPYFCAGCPHNISTKVPEGSRAQAGIGCHFMASWMDRDTAGLIQMGGEGVDWVSHSRFTKVPHVFQNLGDGTYYHSGYLAIRQAIAAKANITYKVLFNDAVAMTGGQPVDGVISVDGIARQVEAEGAAKVVVVSDDIAKYDAQQGRFPAGTEFHDRGELDDVQRRLRETKGVTVLIYEQTCAAEKRRRRKKGELVDPARRLFINERVCEGCGDCSVQSNCVAVVPLETELGRKRKIDQSSCNKDYSCAQGFCPSFVGVVGGSLRKRPGALAGPGAERFAALVAKLPMPEAHRWTGPYDLLVTGVGGTGVVTVGAVIAMAAHLEGHSASVLDFMGFAQKGGSVLSFVRLAKERAALNQVRIDAQQADAVLACDIVVAASPEALQTVRHGRTRVLANTHEIAVAESLSNPDASVQVDALLDKLEFAAGEDRVETMDAQRLAEDFFGDSIVSNILAMGYAWQRGLVPVGHAAMMRAIELNNVAVENNKAAFSLGRLAAAAPVACRELLNEPDPASEKPETLDALVERSRAGLRPTRTSDTRSAIGRWSSAFGPASVRSLAPNRGCRSRTPWPNRCANSWPTRTSTRWPASTPTAGSRASSPSSSKATRRSSSTWRRRRLLKPKGDGRAEHPKKKRFGPWMLKALGVLKHGKVLRGTPFDPFGRTEERRLERRLVDEYEARVDELLAGLSRDRLAVATSIANVPASIRGYGHIKLASLAIARAREQELLNRFDPERYPRPVGKAVAGQFRGIPVASA